ncbi:sister chromatid cohesion protein PDS5 homolog C-like [Gastrolobium bilobum]|uniref:sister chromatid cohesion protein PDS5 homolog C-like n=1 Tax=Gastrolobium bilobum TaxID=150636 RepID=UPI002AAF6FC4|nr:sister chromatid cohesion protein PDS5 homolog C-like [Gastrolobium bilobum]
MADKELEEQLLEAGNKLIDPPSSVEELLSLLDQVESCLSKVEQSPTNSMQNALSPSLKALISEKLLRHSDADVKVAVASCISEITRITAPDAPYDDDQMKEIFQLTVSSFENLHDKSSRSYAKRTSILETVAKVRSCVVMLDLECDALILEMFQHFLKAIREHHPENVFSSMETIMTLVLEESEDISLDLLSPLLASVKKDNKEVFPIAQKLGERVLESCATKLKPYLVLAVKTLGISVDDYSNVLASICQDTSDSLEKNDEDKSESAKQSLEESSTQGIKEDAREAEPSHQDNHVGDRSPKSVMSNGVACVGEENALADSKPIKKQEDADYSDHSKGMNISDHEELKDLEAGKVDNSEQKPKQGRKRRGRKSHSSMAEPSLVQIVTNEKEAHKVLDSESNIKEVPSSPLEDHSVGAAGPSENDKENDDKISSPKARDVESDAVVSPSPTESLHNLNHSKKLGRAKTKDGPAKEGAGEDVSKKESEGTSDSEAKLARRSVKKTLGQNSDVKKTTVEDSVKKGNGDASDKDAKKHSVKKLDENDRVGGGSSLRLPEDKKKSGRGKGNSETSVAKTSGIDVNKEILSSLRSGTKSTQDENSEETPKTNAKRKRTPGKENESDTKEYGQNLVGLRVKVWWPKDREFYKGFVDSFDSSKKKHKVSYDDGDEEILNLGKEKWKVIESDSDTDGEEGNDRASLDASTDMHPKKKGKTAGESTKKGKTDASSRSGGAAASCRSKGSSMKSSHKSKDGSKSKDSKTINKSEDEVSGKSKDSTPKSGSSKSIAAAQKVSSKSKNTNSSKTSKSKNEDISTSKLSAKSKQETPKSGKSMQETPKTAASKGKPPKSGGKSNVNGTGKVKSGILKREDSENENSDVSARKVEDTKGKKASSSKGQGSETKSGKKRRRS